MYLASRIRERGVQRVHRRVDALLGDLPRQHGGGVEVGERGVRRRVGEVVGGHVDRLHRGDRVTAGRGDPLLQLAHLVGQGRLVSHRGRHAAEQRGDLRAGLGEPEDVVDEQQHVLLLHVAEVLRHGQRGQRDPQPGARRLVHLAEHQRGVLDDAGLVHLERRGRCPRGCAPRLRRTPRCRRSSRATRLIISWMSTVLPTPAPPNRPILPPLTYGVSRSRTLMPVSSISVLRLELVERRRVAVDRPALGDLQRGESARRAPRRAC